MLITNEIKTLCDQGRLFEIPPLDWRAPIRRQVFVSPQLHGFLLHPSASKQVKEDCQRLQRLFDRFISGRTISVALKRQIKGSNMKRLSPRSEEVWEFKITQGPQFRVFGRFAQPDVFIALTGPVDRAGCDYSTEIVNCQKEWVYLFPGHPPLFGRVASDYIAANVVSLGNP
jgi:putative component of toxin-antitoxin plasmid stabilization module